MAAASQLWYVPHRPDLLLLAPCDAEGPLPCPGSMYVSIDHLHTPTPDPRVSSNTGASTTATATTTTSSNVSTKWKHPRATSYLTCFGDVAKQQPRVVRCACGASPCALRSLSERGEVPDELIPKDWATKWELPGADSGVGQASEGRRTAAVEMFLVCTGRAEKELPRAPGKDQPEEKDVLAAAEVMLSDFLKGRVCFQCNVPSTRMQRCGRCMQARYCSRECQTAHWRQHKQECAGYKAAAAAMEAPAAKAQEPKEAAADTGAAAAEPAAAAVAEAKSSGSECAGPKGPEADAAAGEAGEAGAAAAPAEAGTSVEPAAAP